MLPYAIDCVPAWKEAWRRTGRLVLLLDFDGTLAPIVPEPGEASMPDATRAALDRLRERPGVEVAVVSGRGLADVRERAAIPGIAYAGNHGMEIEGPGLHRIHPEARAARPHLERVRDELAPFLAAVPGAILEDKDLTLTVHYRKVAAGEVPRVRAAVLRAAGEHPGLHVTEGKMVLEVRPRVAWDKGRAVLFLLEQMRPPAGAPVLYLGDDTTDEDAFRALAERGDPGEGVIVADPVPESTAARSYLREPHEVAALFAALAEE